MPAVLQSRPTAVVGTGTPVEVTWFAAGSTYPILFKFQRQDYRLLGITESAEYPGKVRLSTRNTNIQLEATEGGRIAIITQSYGTVYGSIQLIETNGGAVILHTDIDYTVNESFLLSNGILNLLTDRLGYQTIFTFINPETGETLGSQRISAQTNGDMFLDISSFISSLIQDEPTLSFPTVNASEENSSIPFQITFKDSDFPGNSGTVRSVPDQFYAGFFANQLQDEYGGSLADHVCLVNGGVGGNGHLGKFLSAFERPVYFAGYPWSIGFVIQHQEGFSEDVFRREDQKAAGGGAIATTNTVLTDTDFKKVHQLSLDGTYSPTVEYVELSLETTAFTAPPKVTGIVLLDISSCDTATGEYSIRLGIYWENISSGTLLVTVEGESTESIAVTGQFAEVTLTGLTSNGNTLDVTASFSGQFGSNRTETDLFTAPSGCQDCQIFSVESVSVGAPNLTNNTFPWTFKLDYANSPGGNINVNGEVIAAPVAGVDETVNLPLQSDPIDVTIFFVDDAGCTITQTALVTPPTVYVKRVAEALVATGTNTLPALSATPRSTDNILIEYRHHHYLSAGASPDFSVSGAAITWNVGNAGVDIQGGDTVYVEYETLAASEPGDNWVFEVVNVAALNTLGGFLLYAPIESSFVAYVRGKPYRAIGADQALTVVGNSVSWMNNQGFDLEVGEYVYFRYNTTSATDNEETVMQAMTIAAKNVVPVQLSDDVKDGIDMMAIVGGKAEFNFGPLGSISLSGRTFTFNGVAAEYDLEIGTELIVMFQKQY